MKRRTFIKTSGALGLATLITPSGIFQTKASDFGRAASLEENFMTPPWAARPHTWWHWMNGNVTKEGITLDLEAMAQIGLGGFQNFDAGTGIPKGPIQYLSDEWLALKKHAIAEASRLGLEFTMHNCPGWSSSGGPWIAPEQAMQEVTWSEVVINGGKKTKVQLPQPLTRLGFYRDIKVLAYRAVDGEFFVVPGNDTKRSGTRASKEFLNPHGAAMTVRPEGESKSGFLQIDFSTPQSFQEVSFLTSVPDGQRGPIIFQSSTDGQTFTDFLTVNAGSGFGAPVGEMRVAENFPAIQASSIRLQCNHIRNFSQLRFSNVPRSNDWQKRSNFSFNREGAEPLADASGIVENDILDLTAFLKADGTLEWNAPAGSWTILRVGFTPNGSMNRSAPDSGIGLECDKFNASAIQFHFDKMMENLLPSLAQLGQKGKVGLLIDSYEVGMQNWTEGFENIFQKRNGYDLLKYLPALTGRIVNDSDKTEKFLWDLRRTQGDLMAENYYGKFTALCHQNNMLSYCQPYDRGPMEEMQIGSKVDINVGEFWNTLSSIFQNNWTMRRTVKLSAAIAHTNGQKIVAAESYTGEPESAKWQEYPFGLKALGDRMFTQGLNRMVFHRFAHQPHPTAKPGMTMGPWGSHFDRTNTWWEGGRAWVDYLSRCQYLLQEGSFVADLLYFTGEDASVYTRVERTELRPAPPEGYDYDLVNASTLLKAKVENNRLVLPHGVTYAVLVLQDFKKMSVPLLKKIEQFVQEGLAVVGTKPINVPGLSSGSLSEFQQISERLWGTDGQNKQLTRTVGSGKLFSGQEMNVILRALQIEKDFDHTSRSGDAPLTYIHRKSGDAEIYFIANQRRSTESVVCEFRANGSPEIWNPLNGEITVMNVFSSASGKVKLPLTLSENGSLFVVFKKDNRLPKVAEVSKQDSAVVSTQKYDGVRKLYPEVTNTFSVSLWAKPENHIMLSVNNFMDGQKPWTDYYALYPSPGEKLYGQGHSICGLAIGRNGIALWENSGGKPEFIFSASASLSGWAHVALTYKEGVPEIFLNGKKIATGTKTKYIVHPGVGHVKLEEGASFYNGDLRDIELSAGVLSAEAIESLAKQNPSRNARMLPAVEDRGKDLLFFENGNFTIKTSAGKLISQKISNPDSMKLDSGWSITFPEKSGAPPQILVEKLIPLNEHTNAGVKYFSGTCVYECNFAFTKKIDKNLRWFLDLGAVEVLAEVRVNGQALGVLWSRPFVIDVTNHLKSGSNKLQISVTNLWPNRLIGDEYATDPYKYAPGAGGSGFASLSGGAIQELPDWYKKGQPKPDDGRVTFATWKHYNKESPLLESGLIGPVVLRAAYAKSIDLF